MGTTLHRLRSTILSIYGLIWIDAYSKYGGVKQVSSANGFNTVHKLWEIFFMLGNFLQIVSVKKTPFVFSKFGELLGSQHKICQIC